MDEFFLTSIGQIHYNLIKVGNVQLDGVLLLRCPWFIPACILIIQYGPLFQKFGTEVRKGGRSCVKSL